MRAPNSPEAMPEPDPQPPQPRAVSPARWLLMLLPSVPMILTSEVVDAQVRYGYKVSDETFEAEMQTLLLTFCISAVLSLVMGLLLEKWRHGAIQSFSRILGNAGSILFTNCFVAFGGCAVKSMF